MNKLIIVISFSFLCIYSYAQERFYNLYDGWCILNVSVYEDEYIASGLDAHPTTSANMPQFNFISDIGESTNTFLYSNDTIDGLEGRFCKSYLIKENDILFVGTQIEYFKSFTLTPILANYNIVSNNIDTIILFNYVDNYNSINYFLDTIGDSYVIVGDYHYTDNNSFPILVLTDENGDTISTKRYEFLPTNAIRRRVFPYQLLKLPEGGFLMSCQDDVGSTYSDSYIQRTCFLRLDNEGNEQWRSYTTGTDTITTRPFAALMPDGDYLITWADPNLFDAPNPNRSLWLARMTNDGFIYGKKEISTEIEGFEVNRNYRVNDCYQDENGNVYFAGEKGSVESPGFLLKVNPQGISEWYREYECFADDDAEATYTKIYGITPTEDGGFIMGGEYFCSPSTMFPSGTQQGLVIKVDSMGCLEEGCGTTNIRHTINALNAEIYPNPASEKITITLTGQTNAAHIKIYDAKGCLWINEEYENSEMDISQLPVGIYTVNIWAEGKFYVGKFVKE